MREEEREREGVGGRKQNEGAGWWQGGNGRKREGERAGGGVNYGMGAYDIEWVHNRKPERITLIIRDMSPLFCAQSYTY